MKEQKWSRIVGLNVIGIFLYMVGIKCFAAPAKIAPGGASGIAILVNYVTGFPIGVFCTLFNFPILAVALYKKIFSPLFAVKSAGSIVLLSVMTDIIAPRIPHYQGNPLLAALFAGGFMGIGLALVYLVTSDTGGITMVGLIIKKHIPHLHVGTLVSAIIILVVLVSGIVYRNAESILYAVVTVYVSGLFMDRIVNSANVEKLMIVMGECTDRVRSIFLEEHSGITIVRGEGGYSGQTQRVIMGAVKKTDCDRIQRRIQLEDPGALIIVSEASSVIGKNFGHML